MPSSFVTARCRPTGFGKNANRRAAEKVRDAKALDVAVRKFRCGSACKRKVVVQSVSKNAIPRGGTVPVVLAESGLKYLLKRVRRLAKSLNMQIETERHLAKFSRKRG